MKKLALIIFGIAATTSYAQSTNFTEPLYICQMMHAEEHDYYLVENVFRDHLNGMDRIAQVFLKHGAKIDFGPDWTFIEGVKRYQPDFFKQWVDQGLGVQTHAHETQKNIGEVRKLLIEAGLEDNLVANGGFLQQGPSGTNWVGYLLSFEGENSSNAFKAAVAYKNAHTQEADTSQTCFRPSKTGDWHTPDPYGSLVYLAGSATPGFRGDGLDFNTIDDRILNRANHIIPNRINTMYWHDSADGYYGQQVNFLCNRWDSILTNYLDPLVAQGKVKWATFEEMYHIYLQWEQSLDINEPMTSDSPIQLMQNPILGSLLLELNSVLNPPKNITIQFFDLNGTIIKSTQLIVLNNNVSYKCDVPCGVYIIQLPELHWQQKVVVLK